MELPPREQLEITVLGPAEVPSPLHTSRAAFANEDARVLLSSDTRDMQETLAGGGELPSFEHAGPRRRIFFHPERTTGAIVTCGGLCPGLNDVVRAITLTLHHHYRVPRVLGFRYGFAGLAPDTEHAPIELTPQVVNRIHEDGGTILGSSRGPQPPEAMADTLERLGVSILFAVGGDGTMHGALALQQELARREAPIAVVCVPKTIDNDLPWIERSFGFTTAVEEARKAVMAAHVEATGAWNGVGIVKLMGRQSGFIAAHATLATADVNFCLVPEHPFELEGPAGLYAAVERRLDERHHAVIVVAEGAGQDMLQDSEHAERDPSGNIVLKDVGTFLRDGIKKHFAAAGKEVTVKYIDPSYMIRSLPANSLDSEFCLILGQHAVHAGMSGRTGLLIGRWNGHSVHVPLTLGVSERRRLPESAWLRVLETTGQPPLVCSAS